MAARYTLRVRNRNGRWATVLLIGTLLLFGVLAGCGSSIAGSGQPAGSPRSPAASSATSIPAAPTTTSPPSTPDPSTPAGKPDGGALPEAEDGSDLTACEDGNCQVVVRAPSKLNLGGAGHISELSIDQIADGTVSISAGSASGGSLNSTSTEGGRLLLNDLKIAIVAVRGDQAVLNFSTG